MDTKAIAHATDKNSPANDFDRETETKMKRTDFELSRIYGRGWTDGKKALAERSD
jgi:hypothetical protein